MGGPRHAEEGDSDSASRALGSGKLVVGLAATTFLALTARPRTGSTAIAVVLTAALLWAAERAKRRGADDDAYRRGLIAVVTTSAAFGSWLVGPSAGGALAPLLAVAACAAALVGLSLDHRRVALRALAVRGRRARPATVLTAVTLGSLGAAVGAALPMVGVSSDPAVTVAASYVERHFPEAWTVLGPLVEDRISGRPFGTGATKPTSSRASTSTTAATIDERCPRRSVILEILADGVDDVVGRALQVAWAHEGPAEVGCPSAAPTFGGVLWSVPLRYGKDDPALIVSTTAGDAAVVFTPFVEPIEPALAGLRRVEPRQRFGLGELQLAHWAGGGCSIAVNLRGEPGIPDTQLVPPAVTDLALRLAAGRAAIPYLVAVIVDPDRDVFTIGFVTQSGTGLWGLSVKALEVVPISLDGTGIATTGREASTGSSCPTAADDVTRRAAVFENIVKTRGRKPAPGP